ncbi:MAG TPA: glycosyltransferase family 4 protein [Candidatus Saccharimonadales bacterium]|nr:glycosyltransferase family 4 protein [Candidatus Saccharimonadales bacterium]
MKIGLVFDASLDKADGVAQYVLTVGNWLERQGHEVHYLVGETVRTDLPNLHSLSRNVTVRFNQNRISTPLPAKLEPIKKILSDVPFDILHVQMPYSPLLAARVVKAASPKTAIVGTFHIAPASKMVNVGTRVLGWWLRRNLTRFSSFISVSEVAQEFAHSFFGIDSEVIPNTAPLEHFFDAKPLSKYKKNRIVMFLGRLVERKGCHHLLAAVDKLQRDGAWPSNTKVVVCGAGPMHLALSEQVHRAGLTDIVDFEGFVTEADKPRYLASADIVTFPSTGGESFGIVLLEAMAASPGVVLAGDNPGYTSVMHHHPESLFNPRDTDKFAELLLSWLSNKTARSKAHAWQEEYAHQFEPDVVGQKIMAVYQQALRKKRK